MINTSIQIPYDFNPSDPQSVHDFLIAVKQYVEEIAQKAQQRQTEIRSSVPDVNSVEEGEFVPYSSGGTAKIYTKTLGTVGFITVT